MVDWEVVAGILTFMNIILAKLLKVPFQHYSHFKGLVLFYWLTVLHYTEYMFFF